ncbi:osteocalcin-like [Discoglossus pictus]
MRSLIILSLLGLSAYCLVIKDDKPVVEDSHTLQREEDIKMTRRAANTVIKRHRRADDYYERLYPRVKSQLELKMEQCENYWPCDQLSEWVGFNHAYQQYFGPV